KLSETLVRACDRKTDAQSRIRIYEVVLSAACARTFFGSRIGFLNGTKRDRAGDDDAAFSHQLVYLVDQQKATFLLIFEKAVVELIKLIQDILRPGYKLLQPLRLVLRIFDLVAQFRTLFLEFVYAVSLIAEGVEEEFSRSDGDDNEDRCSQKFKRTQIARENPLERTRKGT